MSRENKNSGSDSKSDFQTINPSVIRGLTSVVAIVLLVTTITFGIDWAGCRKRTSGLKSTVDDQISTAMESRSSVSSTDTALIRNYRGVHTWILRPGAPPLKFAMDAHRVDFDWWSDGQHYVRYIKTDGMPWKPKGSSPEGWIHSSVQYSPGEIRCHAGVISEIHFMVPKSEKKKVGGSLLEVPCTAIELHTTDNPKFDR